ncbi:hypothetical protein BWI93_27290 [Siphonobacter sp. BAB-5385]|uniref:helix-turn-helix domain-containing protein n=1 Tax=Siphonobacter sp. BAB-5385 TaxID=1864822 RepID=UPI000B9E1341|nr:helix-turn-helix transcriptional regulator [Siphonobacter sp. BAB-5385]OZI05094.1 hypothetical protein BWI93_27290 [Siphonobacter sp. BAB-5385]
MQNPESQRIKELRGTETLRTFGEKFGLSHSTVAAIEQGKQSISIPMAKKIADIYNVSLDWLYGLTDQREVNYTKNNQDLTGVVAESNQEYKGGMGADGWSRLVEEKDKQIELLTSFLKNREVDLADCRNQVAYFKNLYDQNSSSK